MEIKYKRPKGLNVEADWEPERGSLFGSPAGARNDVDRGRQAYHGKTSGRWQAIEERRSDQLVHANSL
jgi:hypothetical protein